MTLPTAEKIANLHFCGQVEASDVNQLRDEKWIFTDSTSTNIVHRDFDISGYMGATGAGHSTSVKDFIPLTIARRKVISASFISCIGLLASLHPTLALPLSPKAPTPPTLNELIRQADLIIVGTIEKFVYRGGMAIDEYGKDFEIDNPEENRTLDAVTWIGKILYKSEDKPPHTIRINQLAPRQKIDDFLGKSYIFLLKKRLDITPPSGELLAIYTCLGHPLPKEEKPNVIEIISTIKP